MSYLDEFKLVGGPNSSLTLINDFGDTMLNISSASSPEFPEIGVLSLSQSIREKYHVETIMLYQIGSDLCIKFIRGLFLVL